MQVWIDQSGCVGNGICEELCPDLFEFDGNLAYTRGSDGRRQPNGFDGLVDVAEHLAEDVMDAAEECPASCIHLVG